MRPFRLLLSLTACVLGITFLFFLSVPSQESSHLEIDSSSQKKGRFNAFFSFHAPSSLFSPSAIISLTDDNSTFFLARPAAFGPVLPSKGLSGPLWIGSGFSDDSFGRGGATSSSEGELGCGDVPGWHGRVESDSVSKKGSKSSSYGSGRSNSVSSRLGLKGGKPDEGEADFASTDNEDDDDGTDDYLSNRPPSSKSKKASNSASSDHADIESMQESAEISGKVVLLSRGGCGFLEKVKWVQRRGGTAVIVGDDIRGGPLVTMYARGDTSNVTIPALFTSHTTAHLLSSLIPSGGQISDGSPLEDVIIGKEPDYDPKDDLAGTQAYTTSKSTSNTPVSTASATQENEHNKRTGIFATILSLFGSATNAANDQDDSRRPPSSGNLDWVKVDWEDEKAHNEDTNKKAAPTSKTSSDNFVIGVHDWRDPDLVGSESSANVKDSSDTSSKDQSIEESRSGSIFPGSGEYSSRYPDSTSEDDATDRNSKGQGDGWWARFRWSKSSKDTKTSKVTTSTGTSVPTSTVPTTSPTKKAASIHDHTDDLWVTLTPTSMSSSPFFDTLLVLVVSPLVTLTVVYALLLLRSRIRRRRWRAPKSVVDRLPVRTYQTLPSLAPSTGASGLATPVVPSATTPLLQHTASSSRQPIARSRPSAYSITRPRPRSRTASELTTVQASQPSTSTFPPPTISESRPASRGTIGSTTSSLDSDAAQEKREAGLAEWRRKYGGRQRECVVCLEEYVDGVSRVMSLPCGHEFHADCITPWLTTRRRTCPICKGDVVRSMSRRSQDSVRSDISDAEGSGDAHVRGLGSFAGFASLSQVMSGTSFNSRRRREADGAEAPLLADDEVQALAASTRNESPSAGMPIPIEDDEIFQGDVESGPSVDRERPINNLWGLFGGRSRRGRGIPDRNR